MKHTFDPRLYQGRPYEKERRCALEIISHAVTQADPAVALRKHLSLEKNTLAAGGMAFDLTAFERILVVGAGKAGESMTEACVTILGSHVTGGAVNVPSPGQKKVGPVTLNRAGHPLPDGGSLEGTRAILDILKTTTPNDLVVCLLSGGASALLTLPEEDITLSDLSAATDLILRSGAPIDELNTIRRHLCQVKGGKLARLAAPAPVLSFILSDVVGNTLDTIASGPTAPDRSTFRDALDILESRNLLEKMPRSIMHHLNAGSEGKAGENPGPEDPLFRRVWNIVIGSSEATARGAVEKAEALSFRPLLLTTFLTGEAREAGRFISSLARQIGHSGQPAAPPCCLVATGETTVHVTGNGRGGRNQELALAAAIALDGQERAVIAAFATDGIDGPTDAAGAMVDYTTLAGGKAQGLDPLAFLKDNDSYHYLEMTGDLIRTGATGTNVNDLLLLLVF